MKDEWHTPVKECMDCHRSFNVSEPHCPFCGAVSVILVPNEYCAENMLMEELETKNLCDALGSIK